MKLFAIALVSLFVTSAFAETNFEKIKNLFDAAKAPSSVPAFLAKIPAIKACAEFDRSLNVRSSGLVVVNYTIPDVGPEIPAVKYQGVGFTGAGNRPERFFKGYKENLNAEGGLQISYAYSYNYSDCYGTGADRECDSNTANVSGAATFRQSDKYILYSSRESYGYCWF